MKNLLMIIAIVVSIISAQGIVAQDEVTDDFGYEFFNYENEQQEYAELGIGELPVPVHDSFNENYRNLRVRRAFISKDNTFKIILEGKDSYSKVVFASANGESITPNNKS